MLTYIEPYNSTINLLKAIHLKKKRYSVHKESQRIGTPAKGTNHSFDIYQKCLKKHKKYSENKIQLKKNETKKTDEAEAELTWCDEMYEHP